MQADTLLALFLFAFTTSITPGPNNMMLFASGVNFGFVRTVPHMLGIGAGFFVLLIAVGFGLGALLHSVPLIYTTLKFAGGAYLVVGVDKLAMINNAYGYEAGDGVLIAIGQRLDRCLRTSDVIGRIGADRFGVVLARCSDEQMARAAERIMQAVREEPVEVAGTRVHVTVSIGKDKAGK